MRITPVPRGALPLGLVLLAVGVGGCMTPGAGTAWEGDAAPVVHPWSLTDCEGSVWTVPVESDALRPHVPDGFVLDTSDSGLGPVIGDAYLGFEAFDCAEGAGLDGKVTNLAHASVFTTVTPPDALRVPGIDRYYYRWDLLVPDPDLRAVLADAGLRVHDGTVTLATPGTAGGLSDARFTFADAGAFRVTGAGQPTGDGLGGTIAAFAPLGNGDHALWVTEYVVHAIGSGRGVAEVDAASWVADVLDGTEGAAYFNHGRWSFGPGTLTLPGSPDQ